MFIEVRRFNGHDQAGDDKSRRCSRVICSSADESPELVMFPAELALVPTDRETGCLSGDVDVHSRKRGLYHVKDRRRESCLLVRAGRSAAPLARLSSCR